MLQPEENENKREENINKKGKKEEVNSTLSFSSNPSSLGYSPILESILECEDEGPSGYKYLKALKPPKNSNEETDSEFDFTTDESDLGSEINNQGAYYAVWDSYEREELPVLTKSSSEPNQNVEPNKVPVISLIKSLSS